MKSHLKVGLLGVLWLVVGINTVIIPNPITDSTAIANDQCPGNPNKDDC